MVLKPNLDSNSIFIPSALIHQPRQTPPKQATCSQRTHLQALEPTLSPLLFWQHHCHNTNFLSLLFQQWYCHNTNFFLSFIFGHGQLVKGRKISSSNCDNSIAQFAFFSLSPSVTSFSSLSYFFLQIQQHHYRISPLLMQLKNFE